MRQARSSRSPPTSSARCRWRHATAESITAGAARPEHAGRASGRRQPRQVAGDRCRAHSDARSGPIPRPPSSAARARRRARSPATSAEAASQIKAISSDIERSLSCRHRQYHRQHPDLGAERAERAGGRIQRGQHRRSSPPRPTSSARCWPLSGSFGSTMTGKTDEIVTYVQQHDRPPGADGRQPPRLAGRGAQPPRPPSSPTDIDRVTADALKSIETRGQAFSQSMATNGADVARNDHLRRRSRHRRGGQVAEGPRAVVALGDRPVAPGLDRGRHRDAGDQQDPAHRHGGAVRAAARRQHPAAGSARPAPTTISTRWSARWSPAWPTSCPP